MRHNTTEAIKSYKKQLPLSKNHLRELLNHLEIFDLTEKHFLDYIESLEDMEFDFEGGYTIDGNNLSITSLEYFTENLYRVDEKIDTVTIITHTRSGEKLKLDTSHKNPKWLDYYNVGYEMVVTDFLLQKPMNFDEFKNFVNKSDFGADVYYSKNLIYTVFDFNYNITSIPDALVEQPFRYENNDVQKNITTYTIGDYTFTIDSLEAHQNSLYSICDGNDIERKRDKIVIKHNESGRYLEKGKDRDSLFWYEVTPVTKKVERFVGDCELNKNEHRLLKKFFSQKELSFKECLLLMNQYDIFSHIYKDTSLIYSEIKIDIRYRDIVVDGLILNETDGVYSIDDEKYDLESLKEYTTNLLSVICSYESEPNTDIEYCVIKHNKSGDYMKFEFQQDSYSTSYADKGCRWFEVELDMVDIVIFESV